MGTIEEVKKMFNSGIYTMRIFTRYSELKIILDSLELKKEQYVCSVERVIEKKSGQEFVAARLICNDKEEIYEEICDWSNNKFFDFSTFEVLKYVREKAYFFLVEEMGNKELSKAIMWVYKELENPQAKREFFFYNPNSGTKEQRGSQKRNILIERIEKMGEKTLIEATGMKRNIRGAINTLLIIFPRFKYIYTLNTICDEMCYLKIIASEEECNNFQITFEGILHSFNVTIVKEKNKKTKERTADWLLEDLEEGKNYSYSFNLSDI